MNAPVDTSHSRRQDPTTSPRRPAFIAGAVVLLLALAAGLWWWLAPETLSAAEGPEGARTFAAAPTEIPEILLPEQAHDLRGQASRSGDRWTASVSFLASGDPHELGRAADDLLAAEGFRLQRREYDDVLMHLNYVADDGRTLALTYRHLDDQDDIGVAVIIERP